MDIISFKEYYRTYGQSYLLESFKPKEVDFGNDLKNRVWVTVDGSQFCIRKDKRKFTGELKYTFTKIDDKFYQVYIAEEPEIHSYVFGFTFSDTFEYKYYKNIRYLENNFSFQRSNYGKALKVFNSIFYIVLQGVQRFNLTSISFKALDLDLGDFYKKLIDDHKFLTVLKENGFSFSSEHNGYFVFQKI